MNSIKFINKILVTGGRGTVGSYVKTVFNKSTVFLPGKEILDVTKLDQVERSIKKINPDLIIHLAALTNVDLCQINERLAVKINAEGTRNIAIMCKKYKIPLVYISTSAVFEGKNKKGYSEKDIPKPVNIYSKTKLLGEKIINKEIKNYIIVRGAWMIGGGKKEKKFISYVFDRIKNGETVSAVDDKFGTLTYAKDLLIFIRKRIFHNEFGLYHFGSSGICSRYDIANFIKKEINSNSKIIPAESAEFEDKFSAPRPDFEVIKSDKYPFKNSWQTVLKNYINNDLS